MKVLKILIIEGMAQVFEDSLSSYDSYLFSVPTSSEEANKGMFSFELLLFRYLIVSPKEVSLLLKWWKKQEARFP